MSAPTIDWVRPGVGFTPAAAASWRRMEADAGRPIDVNSSYRDYNAQLAMWRAWTAWTNGTGPRPNHGRAIHPDQSMHCRGLAVDTDDVSLLLALAAHGWRRTAADEPWHFEYQVWRDEHRNRPAGGDERPLPTPIPEESEEDDMANPRQIHYKPPTGPLIRALLVPGTGYFVKWTEGGATYANNIARGMETGSSVEVTASLFGVFEREAIAMRPKDALSIELAEA